MREVSPNRLWIGNAVEARDLSRLLDMGVAALVDLAIEELPPSVVRELVYCRIPLVDGASNPPERLRLAVETVASLIRSRTPTFVFCGAGMSRSPAITAAALAVVQGADPNIVLQRIVAGFPHDVSPALWQEITGSLWA
ncbi:MAG: dual specificity protein phosphatase family protein [Planctomycetales bacterium]|nr:dual specificity protein phosphatase family protein [Planctomycetales bacterium]